MPETPNTLYIPLYTNILRHRKIEYLSAELGIEQDDAVMIMIRLWIWAIEETENGDLTEIKPKHIAQVCRWKGDPERLLVAMVEHEWLDRVDERLVIHEWAAYGGKVLAQRERNRQRQRDHYENQRANRYLTVRDETNGQVTVTPNGTPHSSGENGYLTVSKPLANGLLTSQEESRVDESRGEYKDRPTVAGAGGTFPPLGSVGRSKEEDEILSILQERPDWPRDRGGNTTRELRDILAKNSGVDFIRVAHALKQTNLRARPANLLTYRKFVEAAKKELTLPRVTANPNGHAHGRGSYRDKVQTPVPEGGYALDLSKGDGD